MIMENCMKTAAKACKEAAHWFAPCIKNCWIILLSMTVVVTALHHYFTLMEQFNFDSTTTIMAKIGQLLNGFLETGVLIILLPLRFHELSQNAPPQSVVEFGKKYFWPLFSESLRAMTSVILWVLAPSLLLVLIYFYYPNVNALYAALGLVVLVATYRYLALIFVPYVVYFDTDYQNDKVDALKRSNKLSSGHIMFILLILALTTGIYLGSYNLLASFKGVSYFFMLFAVKLFNMGISVFTYGIFYSLYKQKSQQLAIKGA